MAAESLEMNGAANGDMEESATVTRVNQPHGYQSNQLVSYSMLKGDPHHSGAATGQPVQAQR
ncbi:hypothetical protein CRUP_002537 [Coryphaenoides rupestris]|nr:hypothetical protein CRUP_002537 [Coryphaenoides rupestris]